MIVVRGALALAVLVISALAAATPAGAATKECFLLTQCTPVAGPWVVMPAMGPTTVPAGATVTCPDSDRQLLAVGSDYELSGAGFPRPAVTRFMQGPGIGLITGGVALFYAINPSATAGSFRPHVGCIPQPAAQAAMQTPTGPSELVRTREVRVRASRTLTSSHRCQGGERLVHGVAGVLFHRRRAPTARELRSVTVTHRTRGGRVRARVRTGARVGDRERVTLQLIAVCAP